MTARRDVACERLRAVATRIERRRSAVGDAVAFAIGEVSRVD